jgi:hypothetical protein
MVCFSFQFLGFCINKTALAHVGAGGSVSGWSGSQPAFGFCAISFLIRRKTLSLKVSLLSLLK